jgi:hypothetical protein
VEVGLEALVVAVVLGPHAAFRFDCTASRYGKKKKKKTL